MNWNNYSIWNDSLLEKVIDPKIEKKTQTTVWEWIMNRLYKNSREILIENTWYFMIKILDTGI